MTLEEKLRKTLPSDRTLRVQIAIEKKELTQKQKYAGQLLIRVLEEIRDLEKMQEEDKMLVSNANTLKVSSPVINENKMDYFNKLIKEEFDNYDL